METTYLLVGGDRRQFWLSRLLLSRGSVFTLGVPGLEDQLPRTPAELLILPTPCLDGQGRIRRTQGEGLEPGTLSGLYGPNTRIYGGGIKPALREQLAGCASVTDLLEDPAVAAANGRLTAEAALALAEERLEASVFAQPCTVLGWGRVGKPLAALLAARHARVTVAARREAARAEAAQQGYETRSFGELRPERGLVFNTVPAPVLTPAQRQALGPESLWVELASAPGGLPENAPAAFSVLNGNSLPGRRLPRSAAAVLLEGIMRKEASL